MTSVAHYNLLEHIADGDLGEVHRARDTRVGRTVAIKLRWANFETITRQSTLAQPTNSASDIYIAASTLLESALRSGRKVRLLGVRATNLADGHQLSLFDDTAEKQENEVGRGGCGATTPANLI